jgi:hypothetical protein
MPSRQPWQPDNEARIEANRQTSGLAGVAIVLLLLVAGLFLVHALHDKGRIEDCLMAGRLDCDLVLAGRR